MPEQIERIYPEIYDDMPEIWVPVLGYEGIYEVSCYGKVRGLDRIEKTDKQNKQWSKRFRKGKLITPNNNKNTNYQRIHLRKHGLKVKYELLHRLVAKHFVPNPNNYPDVNHLKGDKKDNRAWMLEWCTKSMNMRHSIYILKRKRSYKKVDQYSKNGIFIRTFDSLVEASEKTGANCINITNCVKGRRKTTGGFKWMYHSKK